MEYDHFFGFGLIVVVILLIVGLLAITFKATKIIKIKDDIIKIKDSEFALKNTIKNFCDNNQEGLIIYESSKKLDFKMNLKNKIIELNLIKGLNKIKVNNCKANVIYQKTDVD